MGGTVLVASLIKTASDYQASFNKYESMQKQKNWMLQQSDEMGTALIKNLRNQYAQYGMGMRQLQEAYGKREEGLRGQIDKTVGSVVAQGGSSGASLGTPGTLSRVKKVQQESGLQGLANMMAGRTEDLGAMKHQYQTSRDTMTYNVQQQQSKLRHEAQALGQSSKDMLHNAQRSAFINFVSTAATLGSAGGVQWFNQGANAATGAAATKGWFSQQQFGGLSQKGMFSKNFWLGKGGTP